MGSRPGRRASTAQAESPVTDAEYEVLATFRYALRKFLRFSEAAARSHGLSPQQHQLLLAVKGFPGRDWASVAELAERLQLESHSVVGLIDRLENAEWVRRTRHTADHRMTEVRLTEQGEALLESLTVAHRAEFRQMAKLIESLRRARTDRDDDPRRR